MKNLESEAIKCPAGVFVAETIRGPACRCRITQETLTVVENAGTLRAFCAADYKACPTWRAEKEAIAERRDKLLHAEIGDVQASLDRPE